MPGHHLTGQVYHRALEPCPFDRRTRRRRGRRPCDQRRVKLLRGGAEAAAGAKGGGAEHQQGEQSALHGRDEIPRIDWDKNSWKFPRFEVNRELSQ